MAIKQRDILVKRSLIKALDGDMVTATLLSQIVWWFTPKKDGTSKVRVERDGKHWIAKTREDWMAECAITRKQYLRAMSVLKERRLIEVRVMKFYGTAMNHLWLDSKCLEKLLSGDSLVVPFGDTRLYPLGTSPCTLSVHPFNNKETENTTEQTTDCGTTAKPGGISFPEEKPQEVRKGENRGKILDEEEKEKIPAEIFVNFVELKEKPMNAKQILELRNGKMPSSVEGLWKQQLALKSSEFQKAITKKEKGQLSQLKQKLGDNLKPVLEYAIHHWGKFAGKASAQAGTKSYPTQPHIGFLLAHYHVAFNLWAAQKNQKPVKSVQTPSIPLQSIAQPAPEKEKPHVATQEEIDALLESLAP